MHLSWFSQKKPFHWSCTSWSNHKQAAASFGSHNPQPLISGTSFNKLDLLIVALDLDGQSRSQTVQNELWLVQQRSNVEKTIEDLHYSVTNHLSYICLEDSCWKWTLSRKARKVVFLQRHRRWNGSSGPSAIGLEARGLGRSSGLTSHTSTLGTTKAQWGYSISRWRICRKLCYTNLQAVLSQIMVLGLHYER